MRRMDFERVLCEAMREHKLVELRYDRDISPRLYQPEGLYHSTASKICVTGRQIRDPNKSGGDNQPRTFEVAEIADLRLSEASFLYPVSFDRSDGKYLHGIICEAR